jgi:toxin ParE1/3/4
VLSLKIKPKARHDLAYIAAWIALEAPAAAVAFRAAVEKEIQLLGLHPHLGRRRNFRAKGIRSWRVSGFENYLIFYQPTGTSLEVVRVLHGSQDLPRILGPSARF